MTEQEYDKLCIHMYLRALKEARTDQLLRRAEEAMNGMLVLNGTGPEPVFVGNPPRWEENPCGVGGYIWTLSRLEYMATLCKAFLLTEDRRYLDKVESDLTNWFETVPVPPIPHDYESACYYHAVHHWRMLEVGYRMVRTVPILLSTLRVHGRNTELLERLRRSIAEHAERIAAGSLLLWPGRDHNHYTTEINGLLSAASMIPEHPKASAWTDWAIEELEKACAAQITEDGAQIEGAAGYHTAAVIDFAYSIHFAAKCGRSFSPEFVDRVKKGIEFSVHTMGPDGTLLPFGDSDGTLLPFGNSDAHLFAPVVAACLGFLLFEDTRCLATLRRFLPEGLIFQSIADSCPWGFDRIPQLLTWLRQPLAPEDSALLPTTNYQRQMDQYICRTGWDRDAACLFFSCHSPIHYGNHAHMDQLGVIFSAYGKRLLQDPGRYTYKSCEDRHLYKSSQVHSVPTVGGRDAFAYLDTFAYGPQKEGAINEVFDTEFAQGAGGSHRNYEPVTVSRTVLLLSGGILLIADSYRHLRGEEIKIFFHLNSTNVAIEGSDVITHDKDVNIRIMPVTTDALRTDILDGRLSDVFYHDYPSKRAVFSRVTAQDQETFLFLAVPFLPGEVSSPEDISLHDGSLTFRFRDRSYHITEDFLRNRDLSFGKR